MGFKIGPHGDNNRRIANGRERRDTVDGEYDRPWRCFDTGLAAEIRNEVDAFIWLNRALS